MPTPILTTKLYIPPPRAEIIARPRLIERLNAGLTTRLTLISAPAGFGKTTLVSQWLAGSGQRAAAWLSLDENDNDSTRFLAYLIAALQTVQPQMGAGALAGLQSNQPPAVESLLTVLLNDIAAAERELVLVLDDYHLIENPQIDQALAFLLEHLPPNLQLVIASREDPQLPLARLRARGQLSEVRAGDLRFQPEEAADYLNQRLGLELAPQDIAALEARTEGWIAGLQLAALALQGGGREGEAAQQFIQNFSGSHRFVLDYLVEEVLLRQPEPVRNFLMQTAILERLSGPLCEAVTGQPDSTQLLAGLERANLFLIPLDDRREWYRYHHLFADVLQARVLQAQAERIPELHRRASDWYAQHGQRAAAIRHALAALDYERAAELIELARPEMEKNFQSATWLRMAQALPEAMLENRPVLCAAYGWALLDNGELEGSARWLRAAEHSLAAPGEEQLVSDLAQFSSLPVSIAAAWAYRALALGDIPDTVRHAQQVLEVATAADIRWRWAALSLLGLTYYMRGELTAAEEVIFEFQEGARQAGQVEEATSITFIMAEIRSAQGRLQQAVADYHYWLQQLAVHGLERSPGAADLYRGLSELLVEQGLLEQAGQELRTASKLAEPAVLTDWAHRLNVSQALLSAAQGNLPTALARLEKAEQVHIRTPLPEVRPIPALKTRLWLRMGRLEQAQAWASRQGLSSQNELSFLDEFDHLTLARLLLARGQQAQDQEARQQASRLLERMLQAAESGERTGRVIEILVLQALEGQMRGDLDAALAALERALALAKPEGYQRIFVDEGPLMGRLLAAAQAQGIEPQYCARLLAAFGTGPEAAGGLPAASVAQPLVEALSKRELEVLALVAQGLSNREIGERLYLAINTVKGHNRRIFGKLGVSNRTEAVARAREMGFI